MLLPFTFSLRAWQKTLLGCLLLVAGSPFAATAQRVLWADAIKPLPTASRASTQALSQYRAVSVQLPAVRAALSEAPPETRLRNSTTVISLPLPNGTSERYRMAQVAVMDPQLAARYPMIKTYVGQSLDDATASVRLDVSPAGFHAMIQGASRTVYIDPATEGNAVEHLVFNRSSMNLTTQSWACTTAGEAPVLPTPTAGRVPNGTTLRTYRLAIACTGEYATTKGGTKASALAAIVASINRVSGVYEKELAIRFTLIPNADTLVFLDPATDRYSNLSNSETLDRNQFVVDSLIGSANYDIGHIFNTADGGIAGLGVVCRPNQKASGSTGLPNPTGDAFDIDYVAHEIGHQFGAEHTFNGTIGSCAGRNRSASSAYEPGSGTTIMAYAGICGSQNIQANSDAYFHSRSYDQILTYVSGLGNCSANTATGNTAPVVNAGANYRIPIGTPFTLTGSATDVDNDALTYSWEQFNLGAGGTPTAPVGNAPIFRVFAPATSPSRTFPRLTDLLANTATIGEILPSYSRRLIFRLVARDNRATGGADYDSMNVVVSGAAGPFLVTVPNAATTSWQAGAPQQVAWDVANTTAAPINAANVDILLSTDGGLSFPTVLLANTPNDGFENVTVPTSVAATTTARIKVQASGNIFFDLSNQNFTIRNSGTPTFFLSTATTQTSAFCTGSSLTVPVAIGALQGFTGTIALSASNLPAGVAVSYDNSSATVGTTVQATITSTSATPAGFYTIALTGISGSESQAQEFSFRVLPIVAATATVVSPAAGSRVGPRPRFSWTAVPDAAAYELQIATDANFTTVVLTQGGIVTTSDTPPSINLTAGNTYYWRVRGVNACGAAPYTAATAFEIGTLICATTAATQLPVTISAATANTVTSVINVQNVERVGDIRIRNLAITHPNVGELTVSLTNPAGRTVVLLANTCPGTGNINVNLSDAATAALSCPLTGSPTYRPANSFASLLNDPANGTWTLTVTDNTPGNGGTLTGWSLELCTVGELPAVPTALTALINSVTNNIANINLVWLDNANNETSYQIERTGANNTTYQLLTTLPANSTFTTTQISGINGTTYCYRIRAVNATGVSAYSNESCVTLAVLSNRNAALLRGVQVFPNPSTGLFQVNIDNAQRGTIRLRVTDALGRTVERAVLNKAGAPLQHSLDLGKLSTGVYQLHLDMPEGTTVVKLIKQ